MKVAIFFWLLIILVAAGCGTKTTNSPPHGSQPGNIEDGDYKGTGKITKINTGLGSVEMDHDDIPGLMPAMRMEFYVADKAMLDGLAVGDSVDFIILYKKGTETITKLTRK